MRGLTDQLRQRVARRDFIVFGAITDGRSGAVVEMFHEAGFDALLVDREHTALNSETILEHIRLARALGLACMVRVADHSYHEICRTLDQAPDGIYVPRIRSRQEVLEVMRALRYPPDGVRGLGASTCPAGRYLGWDTPREMVDTISANLVVGIQIETAEALGDLDGILSVPGVDIAVVGNDDLSLGMGILGELDNPRYLKAVQSVIAACSRHGVLPGIACGDPPRMRYWAEKGMRVFWSASDITLMWAAARSLMQSVRAALPGA
jgi:2-keto-3-deoxy-L-rhamnonate aldolase RhmA